MNLTKFEKELISKQNSKNIEYRDNNPTHKFFMDLIAETCGDLGICNITYEFSSAYGFITVYNGKDLQNNFSSMHLRHQAYNLESLKRVLEHPVIQRFQFTGDTKVRVNEDYDYILRRYGYDYKDITLRDYFDIIDHVISKSYFEIILDFKENAVSFRI